MGRFNGICHITISGELGCIDFPAPQFGNTGRAPSHPLPKTFVCPAFEIGVKFDQAWWGRHHASPHLCCQGEAFQRWGLLVELLAPGSANGSYRCYTNRNSDGGTDGSYRRVPHCCSDNRADGPYRRCSRSLCGPPDPARATSPSAAIHPPPLRLPFNHSLTLPPSLPPSLI